MGCGWNDGDAPISPTGQCKPFADSGRLSKDDGGTREIPRDRWNVEATHRPSRVLDRGFKYGDVYFRARGGSETRLAGGGYIRSRSTEGLDCPCRVRGSERKRNKCVCRHK